MKAKAKSFIVVFLGMSLVLTAAAAAALLVYFRKSTDEKAQSEAAKAAAERRYRQIRSESDFSKTRADFLNRHAGGDSSAIERENQAQILFSMGENAVVLQEPEALQAIVRKLETLAGSEAHLSERIEHFKLKASEFYAFRARSRRFEAHRINSKIVEIESYLAVNSNDSVKAEEKAWLEKTKTLLLDEYPADAERAVDLNAENFRAIYDLTRFLQDKPGGFDKKVLIENYEKVIALGAGKFEKDADYLRANLNLTVLYFKIGDLVKARCYSAQTMEKYLARGQDDYEYLFSQTPDGNWEEPDFVEAVKAVNPDREMRRENCAETANGK